MNNIDKIVFLSNSDSILGHAILKEFDKTESQYFIENFTRNIDLGRNPNFINQSYYEGLRYDPDEFDDSIIDELILGGYLCDTNILDNSDGRFVSVGMKYELQDPNSAGTFYFFRVPYNTIQLNAYYDSNLVATLTLSNPALSDSYIIISSTSAELVFSSDMITTRSYLIAKDETEIDTEGYIAGFQDFYKKLNPCYKMNNKHYPQGGLGGDSIHLIGSDKIYVMSRGTEEGQINKTYRKGDEKVLTNAVFKCMLDGAGDDYDNINHWIQL